MALARKSQMLQASVCLLALFAFTALLTPAVAASQPSLSLASSHGRSLLQDISTAETPAEAPQEEAALDAGLEPAEAPAAAPSSDASDEEDADAPVTESLDADIPDAETEGAETPFAESPLAGAPAAPTEDLDEVVSEELDEDLDVIQTESSSAGTASMGAAVMAIVLSAAMGFVM